MLNFWTSGQGPGAVVPPTLLFAGGFFGAVYGEALAPWPASLSEAADVVGVGLILLGLVLFVSGLLTFSRERTGIMLQHPATRLVTRGPYRWSRNPQYVGFLACYAGASLLSNSFWPWVALPFVVVMTNLFVISREERYMHRRFSREYEAYCRRVPRWL